MWVFVVKNTAMTIVVWIGSRDGSDIRYFSVIVCKYVSLAAVIYWFFVWFVKNSYLCTRFLGMKHVN